MPLPRPQSKSFHKLPKVATICQRLPQDEMSVDIQPFSAQNIHQDKMSQDKMSQDEMSQDEISQDEMSQDEMSQDEMSSGRNVHQDETSASRLA